MSHAPLDDLERELSEKGVAAPEPIEVPESVDRAVIALARDHAARVRREIEGGKTDRRMPAWRRAIPWAAAASVAIGLGILFAVRSGHESADVRRTPVAAAGPDDVNCDGRVDVLDAYAMARAAKREDADRVARIAVSIRAGGRP